jgi:hypothetical protein
LRDKAGFQEANMRLAKPIFIALASLALFATPLFAKNAKGQKADAEDTSPPCSSYQLGPDGNWVPLPCQELGTHSSSQHRAPAKGHEQEAR